MHNKMFNTMLKYINNFDLPPTKEVIDSFIFDQIENDYRVDEIEEKLVEMVKKELDERNIVYKKVQLALSSEEYYNNYDWHYSDSKYIWVVIDDSEEYFNHGFKELTIIRDKFNCALGYTKFSNKDFFFMYKDR